ncbi:hypothetical protein [Lichenibacterium dinghuense]|uniref:hypothetical protein n=1 Tax=Lichenibacterium dinghuense TaxID=2895977 RepID=UPI001F3F1CA7|nr:hypothetical protein [Lichenibacterium sp. 6Y81]
MRRRVDPSKPGCREVWGPSSLGRSIRANLSRMRQQRTRSEIDDTLPGPPVEPAARRHDDGPPEPLDPLHRQAVLEGLDQMRRGELASDDAIDAIYRRAGL